MHSAGLCNMKLYNGNSHWYVGFEHTQPHPCCATLVTNLVCHPPISTLTTVFAINFGPCPFIIVAEPSFSASLPRFQKHFSAVAICFSSTSMPMLISKSRTRSRYLPIVDKNIIFLAFWQHLSPCHGASCFLLPLVIGTVILQ